MKLYFAQEKELLTAGQKVGVMEGRLQGQSVDKEQRYVAEGLPSKCKT